MDLQTSVYTVYPQYSFKMFSANAFKNLSQSEAYKQYSTLYEKLEEKQNLSKITSPSWCTDLH